MRPKRGRVIRPLLALRRSEIEAYLLQEGLAFCTDETNLLREGTRNRLRLDVLPEERIPQRGLCRFLSVRGRRGACAVHGGVAYGSDIGGGFAMGSGDSAGYFDMANKDALTRRVAAINAEIESSLSGFPV